MKSSKKPVPAKARTRANSKPHASSTADILGAVANSNHIRIPAKWARQHRNLLQLRDQLLAQSGKLAREATEGVPSYSMHMADAGTDSFDRDFALSMLSSDQDALFEVEEAIKRIERGSYGICELTGKTIPLNRLEAIPWARFTADAQRQLERDGALRRRQLSAFSALPASDNSESDEGEEGGGEAADKD